MIAARPTSVVVAASVTIAMATVFAAVAIWDLVAGDTTGPRLGTNYYYIIAAAILIPASLALLSGRTWPRGVLVTSHLLIVLSMIALAAVLGWIAVLAVGLSTVALLALATPSARAFLSGGRRDNFLDD